MAFDKLHDHIKRTLESNGFKCLNDPLTLHYDGLKFFIDLEMERDHQKYAIEIKSFNNSFLAEFYKMLGQVLIYKRILKLKGLSHQLYTAMSSDMYQTYLTDKFSKLILTRYHVSILTVNREKKTLAFYNF